MLDKVVPLDIFEVFINMIDYIGRTDTRRACWCVTVESASLYTITSKLRVREQD